MEKEMLNLVENVEADEKTKEERIIEFIKALVAVEESMKPFKEHKKDLRESYVSNGWLTKEEVKMSIKALRLLKDETDLEQLTDFYKALKLGTGM
jgi:hypothetical protein